MWESITEAEFFLVQGGYSWSDIERMAPVERDRHYDLLKELKEEEKKQYDRMEADAKAKRK